MKGVEARTKGSVDFAGSYLYSVRKLIEKRMRPWFPSCPILSKLMFEQSSFAQTARDTTGQSQGFLTIFV